MLLCCSSYSAQYRPYDVLLASYRRLSIVLARVFEARLHYRWPSAPRCCNSACAASDVTRHGHADDGEREQASRHPLAKRHA